MHFPKIALILPCSLFVCLMASARAPFSQTQSFLLEPEVAEEARATVERGIADLENEDPGIRAGAVMLLGKYELREARQAVIQSLDDPAPQVRRAAVIAALDWKYELPPSGAVAMLDRLVDEDLEVRRDVSAMLPLIATKAQQASLIQGGALGLPQEKHGVIRQAFADEDPFVRENMLAAQHLLRVSLSEEHWIALARDDVPAVRRRALPLALQQVSFASLYPVLHHWAVQGEAEDRLLVAEAVLYQRDQRARELLMDLSDDPADEVASAALIGLMRREPSEPWFDAIIGRLEQGQMATEQGKLALRLMLSRAPLDEARLARITSIKRSAWQGEIAQIELASLMGEPLRKAVLGRIGSSSGDVRRVAMSYLSGLPELLIEDTFWTLLESPHEDVRERGVALLLQAPQGLSGKLAPEFLFDPAGSVRAAALRFVMDRRVPGFERMVAGAMTDPDATVRNLAFNSLRRLPTEAQDMIIKLWRETNPEAEVPSALRRYFPQ